MIFGAHVVLYSKDATADRAFLLGRVGLLPRLALGRRNVCATCANAGLFGGFRLRDSRRGVFGLAFFSNRRHVFSFRGKHRGHDMDHSGTPERQAKSHATKGGLWRAERGAELDARLGHEMLGQQRLIQVDGHGFGPGPVKTIAVTALAQRRSEMVQERHCDILNE